MNYLDDWSLYNQKNLLKAKEFVNDNFFRLIQFFNFEIRNASLRKRILSEAKGDANERFFATKRQITVKHDPRQQQPDGI